MPTRRVAHRPSQVRMVYKLEQRLSEPVDVPDRDGPTTACHGDLGNDPDRGADDRHSARRSLARHH
jgi:hypothetical protein